MLRKTIEAERLKQSLSVYKLAKLTGLQITQLNGFLKGKKQLQSNAIENLLEVLKLRFTSGV